MKSLLLLAFAVSLSGSVQAGPIESYHGKCHDWLEEIEEHNRRKEEPGYDAHAHEHSYKHEMVPECDDHGNFVPKQCHVFKYDDEWCQPDGVCYHFRTGEKWCACVDVYSGMPDKSSIVLGGYNLHCDAEPKLSCPWSWMKFGEHGHEKCYIFISTPKSWVDAERYCQFDNAHLASVHCEETDRFLEALTRGNTHTFPPTWLGASNAVKPCWWFWSDGDIFDYDEFYAESDRELADSCLSMNFKFKWAPKRCNETLPFICAKKATYSHEKYIEYEHH